MRKHQTPSDRRRSKSYELRAGPLSMLFEKNTASLRYIRMGDREVLRGVYVALRDQFWNTIASQVQNVVLQHDGKWFSITFDVACQQGEIDFVWQGRIEGREEGAIDFSMEGNARSSFLRNRIGFCVLHPAECAGHPCLITHSDGSEECSRFPEEISPYQPFSDVRSIGFEPEPGLWLKVQFNGDVFETEDQRNWTDSSFKTYCTPLELPRPVEMCTGDAVRQAVTVSLEGRRTMAPQILAEPAALRRGGVALARLPQIGLCTASHGRLLSEREASLLSLLRLDHLRVDVRLDEPGESTMALQRAAHDAAAIHAKLEIAMRCPAEATPQQLDPLLAELSGIPASVVRWLFFRGDGGAITGKSFDDLRRRLLAATPHAEFGTGTDLYFAELNRERPVVRDADVICYSLNPQVHAFDDWSLMETLDGQSATARNARCLYPHQRLAVSPVTLKPRFNPDCAGGPFGSDHAAEVDPRQSTFFTAAWTLGSLRRLAEEGAASVTYFETTGGRGVIETDERFSSHPQFPSQARAILPVYWLLKELAELRGRPVDLLRCARPLEVEGFTVSVGDRQVTLLANLTPYCQSVSLVPGETQSKRQIQLFDAERAHVAMHSPDKLSETSSVPVIGNEITLEPYALARIDDRVS
jgi:D-apionolactonase